MVDSKDEIQFGMERIFRALLDLEEFLDEEQAEVFSANDFDAIRRLRRQLIELVLAQDEVSSNDILRLLNDLGDLGQALALDLTPSILSLMSDQPSKAERVIAVLGSIASIVSSSGDIADRIDKQPEVTVIVCEVSKDFLESEDGKLYTIDSDEDRPDNEDATKTRMDRHVYAPRRRGEEQPKP